MALSRKEFLHLLEGPGVAVVVGSMNGGRNCTWTLPKALLCHHSVFFRNNNAKSTIMLRKYDPDIFRLFVEWMYHGSFTVEDVAARSPDIYISVEAWLLGDKISAHEFRDDAMRQIQQSYTPAATFHQTRYQITPALIEYVCVSCERRSHLFRYFFDATSYFWDEPSGTVIENGDESKASWNALWHNIPDFRNNLFYTFRLSRHKRKDIFESGGYTSLHEAGRVTDRGGNSKDQMQESAPKRIKIET